MFRLKIPLNQIGLFPYKALLHKSAQQILSRFTGKILDIGAGKQPFRAYLNPGIEYVTMDYNDTNFPDIVGDIQKIDLPAESFDGVLCTEVLEHVPEPLEALNGLNRIIKEGGYLYLTVPMCWGLHYEPNDYFRFTKYGVKYLLQKSNFKIMEIMQIGGTFTVILARFLDINSTILYQTSSPLKYLIGDTLRIKIVSICMFPFVILLNYISNLLDSVIPRANEDALGWAVLCKKETKTKSCKSQSYR